MRKSFNLVKGNRVPNLEGIEEGFSISSNNEYHKITVNVSAENIDYVFTSLFSKVKAPGFLLLEHGTNRNVERQIRKADSDPFHRDIYYLDELDQKSFLEIYYEYKELLIHDGNINFGFGSHVEIDEVFIGTYKIFTVFTKEVEKYVQILLSLGFPKVENIKTVKQNFSPTSPGSRMAIKHNGIGVCEMIKELTNKGLYLAERREVW